MATKYGGYMDRVVLVDLTEHTVENYPWTDEDQCHDHRHNAIYQSRQFYAWNRSRNHSDGGFSDD